MKIFSEFSQWHSQYHSNNRKSGSSGVAERRNIGCAVTHKETSRAISFSLQHIPAPIGHFPCFSADLIFRFNALKQQREV